MTISQYLNAVSEPQHNVVQTSWNWSRQCEKVITREGFLTDESGSYCKGKAKYTPFGFVQVHQFGVVYFR